MSAPTFEQTSTSSLPALPELSRRVIFKLGPADAKHPFALDDADKFAHGLRSEETKGHSDYTLHIMHGSYLVDFHDINPTHAVERIALALFKGFGTEYGNAILDEARVERVAHILQSSEAPEAWEQMDRVTRLADSQLMHHRAELLGQAATHFLYEASV